MKRILSLILCAAIAFTPASFAARTDIIMGGFGGGFDYSSEGTKYLVEETSSGDLYAVYVDAAQDVVYIKSVDDGITWSEPVVVYTGTAMVAALWYDRWSSIGADLIHIVYTDTANDDTLYRSLDTASDTLGTQTQILDGTSATGNASLSITRARGGNLYVYTDIDGGAEGGFYRSTDVGATWGSRTAPEAIAGDQMALLPGWAADNQDIMGAYWDHSANEITMYVHDDSLNSWAETAGFTGMAETLTSSYPNMGVMVDIANSRNLVAAWSAVDAANADLRVATMVEASFTEVTNAVLNSTDDQALVAICVATDTGYWHVIYGGKSDGSETFTTSINLYEKISTDSGSTWGSETLLTTFGTDRRQIFGCGRFAGDVKVGYSANNPTAAEYMRVNVELPAAGGGLAANPVRGFVH